MEIIYPLQKLELLTLTDHSSGTFCSTVYIVDVMRNNSLFVGCHLKFHKDHFDNSEEFVGPCKGETFLLFVHICVW